MSTISKEWLQKAISQHESMRDEIPFGLDEDDSNTLAALRIALASLETEASGRNPVLAYADSYRDMANQGVESIPVWSVITDLERNIAPLFTAPPPPLSVPAAMEMDDDFDSAFEHGKAVGWNACRAAMLQAGNSPVIPDDVRRMDWLVSKTVDVREPMVYGSHSLFWSQTITDEEDDYHATKLREQIDAAMAAEQAAAPQQEVTQALAKGMERYGDAMQKLADSGD